MKGKFSSALSLALIMAMLVTNLAFADNVENDIVVDPASITLQAGVVSSFVDVQFYVQPTSGGGDPDQQCNFDTASEKVTFTINTPAGVTADPSSLTFNECKVGGDFNYQSVRFNASASAVSGYISFTQTFNNSGGTFNYNNAVFYINVTTPPPSDTAAPTASPTQDPAANVNGWNNTDVTVYWNWTDESGGSGIDALNCTMSSTSSGEGEITLSASCKDLAGNTGNASYTVKVDKTAPDITFVFPPTSAWYNADVTANWSCSDATSGAVSSSVSALASGEGSAIPATGTCTDNAGNTASDTQTFMIDKTAPVVTVTGVTNGEQYVLGSVPAAGCSTTDALSGVATYASLGLSGGPVVGFFTVTCSGAFDNAGNAGNTATATYQVVYAWNGFFQPIDNGTNVWNTVKAGSAVPVKFSLGGDQGLGIFASGYPKLFKVSCTAGTEDAIETTVTAGGSSLTYDTLAGQYIYVWKTEKSWANTCGRLYVTLIDGTTHSANFKFK